MARQLLLLTLVACPAAAWRLPAVTHSRPGTLSSQPHARCSVRAQMQLPNVDDHEPIERRRPVILELRRAFALVFNPRTDNEGIYSRRSGEDGIDMILCFEEHEDAERYANMLTAQDFLEATPVEMDTRILLEFCDDGEKAPLHPDVSPRARRSSPALLQRCAGGFSLGLVRQGSLVVPPEANVPKFDWSPGSSAEGAFCSICG